MCEGYVDVVATVPTKYTILAVGVPVRAAAALSQRNLTYARSIIAASSDATMLQPLGVEAGRTGVTSAIYRRTQ